MAVLTDARFSGVSTGACIGHISPEALAGGPIGKVLEGDQIEIVIDRKSLLGIGAPGGRRGDERLARRKARGGWQQRKPRADLQPHPQLPDDTRLWAALVQASGGVWGGCVYDVDKIISKLEKTRVKLYRTSNGNFVEEGGSYYRVPELALGCACDARRSARRILRAIVEEGRARRRILRLRRCWRRSATRRCGRRA